MGTINAYRDSSDAKLVHIVPSGFQTGESSNINIKFKLSGYDETVVTMSATDEIQQPQPQEQPVEVSETSVTGYCNINKIINVTTPGTFTAISDNPNISVALDQSQRTISIFVETANQTTDQEGTIIVSIYGYTDTVIDVNLIGLDDITINGAPTGQQQYVNEPITLTVTGTTKELTAESSSPSVNVVKDESLPYTWTATATQAESLVNITFTGEGVKTKYKRYTFLEQETPTVTMEREAPYYVGDTVKMVISGLTSFDGLVVSSDNPDITVTSIPNEDGAYNVHFTENGRCNITLNKRGMVSTVKVLETSADDTLVPSVSSVNMRVNETTRITITGTSNTISATCDNSNISVSVEGNVVVVTSTSAQSGTITVTADHATSLRIPVNIAELESISYSLSTPSGELYIGEPYRITVEGSLSNVRMSSSDPRVVVSESDLGSNIWSVTSAPSSGTTEVTSEITISADGKANTVVPIRFLGLLVLSATEDRNSVPYDMPITLTLSGGKEGMLVSTDSVNVTAEIVNQDGTYKVICRGHQEGDSTITVYGRGIKDFKYIVSFTAKDTLTYSLTPLYSSYYVGEDITVNIEGTSRTVEFTIDDGPGDNAVLRETDPVNPYSKIIDADNPCTINVSVRGEGCNSVTIPNIVFRNPTTPTYRLSKSNNLFIGDVTVLTVTSDVDGYVVEASDPKIQITKTQDGVYNVTASMQVTGEIRINGSRGIREVVIPLEFQDDQTPTLNLTTNETTYDCSINMRVDGVTEAYTVSAIPAGPIISKVSENNYTISTTSVWSGEIVVVGDNVKDTRETITFIDKDTLSVTMTPNRASYYLGEKVVISVQGTTKPYTVVGRTPSGVIVNVNEESPGQYSLTSDQDTTITVTITGTGIHAKTFDIVYLANETPLLSLLMNNERISYMYSNETAVLDIRNVSRDITVNGDSLITVNKNREGLYEVTASGHGRGVITVNGSGVNETTIEVEVKDTYTVTYEMIPSNGINYVNRPITLRSLGDEDLSVTAKAGSEFLEIN